MLFFVALLAGAAAEPAPESFRYRTSEALIVNSNGKPLFRTSLDFLLTVSGNSEARVLAFDAERRMVRVSKNNAWWISCEQLQPLKTACVVPVPKLKTRGFRLPPQNGDQVNNGSTGPEGRGVPSCPGDPRCPTGG